ncbi:hypothetical protein C8J57DRAFT_1714027 [Mycena rebaudengoi]|nr:hypothetical protein C8J57DRAFT_1714027 [Mycena rebaudengoi]
MGEQRREFGFTFEAHLIVRIWLRGEKLMSSLRDRLPLFLCETFTAVDLNSEDIAAVPQTASPCVETVATGYDQGMTTESTVEEILRACERQDVCKGSRVSEPEDWQVPHRISRGAGKSSLINSVFTVNDAGSVVFNRITSETNPLFVLHDSKGFEPANMNTFKVSNAVLEDTPQLECVLIAYTVDLIIVLEEPFK